MDLIELIVSRRSIRKFLPSEISPEIVNTLLQSGMYAPTARNTQSWEFVVINDRKLLDELAIIHPYAKMLKYAPLAILVCGNINLEENEAYINQNCSAATQNILLAAHAKGIGSVWLGVYPKTDRINPIKNLLSLPENILPVSLIALGYSDEKKEHPERFTAEKVHYNSFQ